MSSPCKYHYKIRCPHCLATLTNDQVEFEVDPTIISQLESDLKIKPKKDRGGDNTKRTIDELRTIQKALEASEKKDLAEIEFVNLSDEQPDNGQLPIVLPRGFSEDTKDNYPNIVEEELTTEVIIRIRDNNNQAWTIKTSTDRYCSKCEKRYKRAVSIRQTSLPAGALFASPGDGGLLPP